MMKNVVPAAAFALAVGTGASASVLWDNGPLVTHPGAGPGGVDVSMASSIPNAAGSNATATVWRADDFSVGGLGWNVSAIDFFAYDTNFSDPRWDAAHLEIRQGSIDGPVVASAAATWQLAGINRTFTGVLDNTARQISRLTADFGSLILAPDVYWVAVSITHSEGQNSWIPFVMDPNPDNPDDPITRTGNSMVSTNGGETWSAWTVTTGGWNQTPEMPFLVHGQIIPAPGALALLGLAGLIGTSRRRR